MKRSSFHFLLRCGFIVAWIGVALFGWTELYRHTYEPSQNVLPTDDVVLQLDSDVELSKGRFQIVVFAHPLCPCTHAALDMLNESLTRLPQDTAIRVVFVIKGLPGSAAADSKTVRFAKQLPGVEVQFDETGVAAAKYGARVSGEVFAFDKTGTCVFHGGLTSGRGHRGESTGQRELECRAAGNANNRYDGPVFGCRLPVTELNPSSKHTLDHKVHLEASLP